jgi:hypothetical protein
MCTVGDKGAGDADMEEGGGRIITACCGIVCWDVCDCEWEKS